MTCYLFWVAAPATPQPKIPPHPQPRATCFFDGRNSQAQPQLYQILVLIFILSSIKLVKKGFFKVKKLLKGSIFELQNCNKCLKKGHSNLHSLHYCWKTCEVAIAHRNLKMHRTHAHRKFQQNGFAPAHRNLLPHIATRNLLSHIASHALLHM